MNKYSLKNHINGADGTSVYAPIVPESVAFRRAYLAEMRRLIAHIAKATREQIITSYRSELITDARESDFEALRRVIKGLLSSTNETVKRLLELEAIKHTDRFAAASRAAFKIDLAGVITSEDLSRYVDQAALRNASLVTGMTDDLVKKIQVTTTNSLIKGETVGELRKKLKAEFEISDRRAQLIASDQTSKLNADLNKIRHLQAGVDEYEWWTSRDERVRARHASLHGNSYKYNEPTGAEDGLEPGQPIRCRCVARGVVKFGEQSNEKETLKAPSQPGVKSSSKKAPVKNPKIPQSNPKPLPEISDVSKTAKFITSQNIAEQGSSFKDFDLDGVAEMLITQHALNHRFGMKKLVGFGNNGWAAGKAAGAKKLPATTPGWFAMKGNVVGFNPIASSRQGLRELSQLSEGGVKRNHAKRLSAIDNIKNAELKQKALAFADDFRYQSVPVTPASVVAHENGHRFHANYYNAVEKALDGWDEGWSHLMSQYGSTNRLEYVAESFALYTSDPSQHWRIKPSLLAVFKEKDLSK